MSSPGSRCEMRVLVTRPRDAADATAEKLRALGHAAIAAPLMEIRFRDGDALRLDGVQAILATSANGARAVARRTAQRDVPLFAVGRQTAEAARVAGFTTVRSADGDGADLVQAATLWAKPRRRCALLHAVALEDQRRSRRRAAQHIRLLDVRTEICTRPSPATSLPVPADTSVPRTGALDAVMLFSPRGARVFSSLIEQAWPRILRHRHRALHQRGHSAGAGRSGLSRHSGRRAAGSGRDAGAGWRGPAPPVDLSPAWRHA